ncbi:MAG TPA: IclR family transcriptional regulator [Syntrophales bacterium]|nr:IclR family transcriptional regulator [Syntrophales bacterium]HOL58539.1 IclR family transcriptional regulator [Syntrophales bacterium]HPO34853.1 IclR family transcriptional regulator [Syntrophales bacterium]
MIQSVDRALEILELFQGGAESVGITEVAKHLGISKAAAYALMTTLQKRNFLKQDQNSRRYKLGFKLLQLGALFVNQSELGRAAQPWAVNLCNRFGEVVHISIFAAEAALIVHRFEPKEPFLLYPQPGSTMPLYSTAGGKVLLAYAPPEIQEKFLSQAPFPPKTPNTIVKKSDLLREIKIIQKQEYAEDREETIIGVACVGAPIRDKSGRVIAAISLTGSKTRMEERGWEEIVKAVKMTALQISSALGYRMDMGG